MIKHVVCFKLADNSDEKKAEAKKILLSMDGNVPSLRGIEVGTDFLGSARSYDVILIATNITAPSSKNTCTRTSRRPWRWITKSEVLPLCR